jgi:hypothetical protein
VPEVEICCIEDRDDLDPGIGHNDLGWSVIADIGIRKLVNLPDGGARPRNRVGRPPRNRHAEQFPAFGEIQWAIVNNVTYAHGL